MESAVVTARKRPIKIALAAAYGSIEDRSMP
jgi:hypothetical protein